MYYNIKQIKYIWSYITILNDDNENIVDKNLNKNIKFIFSDINHHNNLFNFNCNNVVYIVNDNEN